MESPWEPILGSQPPSLCAQAWDGTWWVLSQCLEPQ